MTTRTRLLILAAPALSAVLVAQQNAPPVRNPLGGDPAVAAEGQTLFNQVCQSCHGPGGQGSDRGPALTRTTLKHGNADADLFRAIRTGVPGTQMPPFAGFTDAQIWQLVSYIRSLQGPRRRRSRRRRRQETSPPAKRCSLAAPRARLPRSERTRRRGRSGACRTRADSRPPCCARRSSIRPRRQPPRAAAGVGGRRPHGERSS